ncbi:MAG: Do family serine endopeptidase [Desulfuromonadales bacterium]|nr:Do family serine endopeptidase [Desulfuromonadales bacterium]
MPRRFSQLLCGVALSFGLVLAGCDEQPQATIEKSIRTAEARPPVEQPPADLLTTQRAFTEVSAKVTPAVVNIRAERVRVASRLGPLFEDFFGDRFRAPRAPQSEQSLGSGFIISAEGIILTNAHVVDGAEQIKVRLPDQRVFPGEVLGLDPKTDVAVLKIKSDQPLPVTVLGDSDRIRVGQWALAIGNPFGLDGTLTVGVVSATERANVGIEDYEDFIQTDASINPGNSGGPLLNVYGEVVGMNTAIVAAGQGIGFAIPINLARQVAEQLIANGEVTRGWLGVTMQPLDPALAESFGLDKVTGALVTKVLPDTPAERAGVRRGDVLLTFAGKTVRGVRELQLLVASAPIGKAVPVEIVRDGRRLTLSVVITARDERPESGRVRPPSKGKG